MKLLEWTEIFLNYRKAMGLIVDFQKQNNQFIVKKKNQVTKFFVFDDLQELNIKSEDISEGDSVVTLNTKQNLDFLIKNWDFFLDKNLTVLFVNPKVNEKWSVNTKTHSFVTDRKNIAKSLRALFEGVQEV